MQIFQKFLWCLVIVLLLQTVLEKFHSYQQLLYRTTASQVPHVDHVQTYEIWDNLVVIREEFLVRQCHKVSRDSTAAQGTVSSSFSYTCGICTYPLSVEFMTACKICWHSATSEGSIFLGPRA